MRLAELKSRFWSDPSASETFEPLTDADVARAEAALGVRLPAAYLELLRVQNGGYVSDEFDAYPTGEPTSWAADHVPLDTLAGIGPSDHWASVTTPAAPEGVACLSGDGHYWIVLDYRGGGGEPSVAWLDTEVGGDLQLAPSFLSFVEGLVPGEEFEIEDGPPRVHVLRAATGDTYCGSTTRDDVVHVTVDQHVADGTATCPDCVQLLEAWRRTGRL